MLILEAVRLALAHKSVQARKKIININVKSKQRRIVATVDNTFDERAPKPFSYLDAAVIAMTTGKKKKTAKEIAESIVDQREACY
jgi:hypothetical protein